MEFWQYEELWCFKSMNTHFVLTSHYSNNTCLTLQRPRGDCDFITKIPKSVSPHAQKYHIYQSAGAR